VFGAGIQGLTDGSAIFHLTVVFFAYLATPVSSVVAATSVNYYVVITGADNASVMYGTLDTLEQS